MLLPEVSKVTPPAENIALPPDSGEGIIIHTTFLLLLRKSLICVPAIMLLSCSSTSDNACPRNQISWQTSSHHPSPARTLPHLCSHNPGLCLLLCWRQCLPHNPGTLVYILHRGAGPLTCMSKYLFNLFFNLAFILQRQVRKS